MPLNCSFTMQSYQRTKKPCWEPENHVGSFQLRMSQILDISKLTVGCRLEKWKVLRFSILIDKESICSLCLILSLICFLIFSFSYSLCQIQFAFLHHTHTHSYTHTHSLSLSLTHTQTHTHSLSQSHSHSHTIFHIQTQVWTETHVPLTPTEPSYTE
jgi:hypothetical protein